MSDETERVVECWLAMGCEDGPALRARARDVLAGAPWPAEWAGTVRLKAARALARLHGYSVAPASAAASHKESWEEVTNGARA